eukprot:724394-Rhodomonas_salina.1
MRKGKKTTLAALFSPKNVRNHPVQAGTIQSACPTDTGARSTDALNALALSFQVDVGADGAEHQPHLLLYLQRKRNLGPSTSVGARRRQRRHDQVRGRGDRASGQT